jgi:hypothetical protein
MSESPHRKRWPPQAEGLQSGRVFIRQIALFGPKEIQLICMANQTEKASARKQRPQLAGAATQLRPQLR